MPKNKNNTNSNTKSKIGVRKNSFRRTGKALYFLTWPGIWFIIKIQPPRTRVVIINNSRVLLVRDWLGSGKWSLPGGGLHRREDPAAGAVREVYEETGIRILPKQLISLGQRKIKSSGMLVDTIGFYIVLEKHVEPKARQEIAECRWFSLDELTSIKLSPTATVTLSAFRDKQPVLE